MWNSEMVRILRYLINDLETPPTYTDERLQELILVAAQYVYGELNFDQEYTIDVDELTIDPDPTDRDAGTRDDLFMNLVILKAACLVDSSEARTAAGKAFTLKQGNNSINYGGTGGVADSKLKLWEKGWCDSYKKAKEEYLLGNYIGIAGYMVTGPTALCYPQGGRYR